MAKRRLRLLVSASFLFASFYYTVFATRAQTAATFISQVV